jgi:hypothetical protein
VEGARKWRNLEAVSTFQRFMFRSRHAGAGGMALALVALAGSAVAAPMLDVQTAGGIGDSLTVRTSGGLTPALSYRAAFTESAKDRHPGRQCARNIDRPYRTGTSTTRVYVFRGRIPRTLACTQGRRRFLIAVKPGRYVIVVGHKIGKASWDPNAVTLRRGIEVTG